jgi:hypothetical protein
VFNPLSQVGDVKPLGPVWPQRSIDKVKRKENEAGQDDEQRNKQSHDERDNDDGHSVDEYA